MYKDFWLFGEKTQFNIDSFVFLNIQSDIHENTFFF